MLPLSFGPSREHFFKLLTHLDFDSNFLRSTARSASKIDGNKDASGTLSEYLIADVQMFTMCTRHCIRTTEHGDKSKSDCRISVISHN